MDLQLQGKNALITGSTKGIGRAIAELLAAEGCNLGICARNQQEVDSAIAELATAGVTVVGGSVDINDADAIVQWVDHCADKLGGIDIVIPNVSAGGTEATEPGWKANFDADLMGTVRCVNAALGYLEQSAAASIVVISSTAAIETFAGAGPYAAMKAALLNYTGNLCQDLAAKGIRVNAVSPGPIFVDGGAWDMIKNTMPEIYDNTVAAIPLGRMGTATEVAAQVALLASPMASYTTGTNVVIDGAFTKRLQF